MDSTKASMVISLLVFLSCSSANAATASPPSISPAPAPAPDYVNLTQLLSVAGPFDIFLNYLKTTKVLAQLQNQANNTEEGITLFVPKDTAFTSLKTPSLSNLTSQQLQSLCLFHALPHFYTLAEFQNLSKSGPIPTLAGGQYRLNFTDNTGSIRIGSGWTNTIISSAVHSTPPVSVFQVNKVLLPEAIFGTDIPPTPAPAPAPEGPIADAPSADAGKGSSSTSKKSSSHRLIVGRFLVLAISGGLVVFL